MYDQKIHEKPDEILIDSTVRFIPHNQLSEVAVHSAQSCCV